MRRLLPLLALLVCLPASPPARADTVEMPAAGPDEQLHRLWALLADYDGGPPSGEWICVYTDAGGEGRCTLTSFDEMAGACRGAHYP